MKNSSLFTSPGLRKRQAGYTLIELSISLAIIAVLLVGTLTGVQSLLRANNANNTISSTQAAITNITKLYAASSDKTIYAHAELAKMGVWEKSALTTTTVGTVTTATGAKNPFGGSITVYRNKTGFGADLNAVADDIGYWYRLNGIPGESCASVATSFVNTADAIYISQAASILETRPNTNGYKDPSTKSTANLATGCNTVAADGTVTIHLYIPS